MNIKTLVIAVALLGAGFSTRSLGGFTYGATTIAHDTVLRSVQSSDCTPGAYCQLGTISFGVAQQFGNLHYSCYAGQPPDLGVAIIPGLAIQFYAQTTLEAAVGFVNTAPYSIPLGTQVGVAYTCVGCAIGHACGDTRRLR